MTDCLDLRGKDRLEQGKNEVFGFPWKQKLHDQRIKILVVIHVYMWHQL